MDPLKSSSIVRDSRRLCRAGNTSGTLSAAAVTSTFAVNSSNGMLMLGSTLTTVSVGSYAVTVMATNSGSPPRSASVNVNVSVLAASTSYAPYFLNPPIASTTLYFFSVQLLLAYNITVVNSYLIIHTVH